MNKLTAAAALLTALALLTGLALLPRLASDAGDTRTAGQVRFAAMEPVTLTIREERPLASRLAFTAKLIGSVTVSDSKASMTCEEAEAAALAAVQSYLDAGLIDSFDIGAVEVRCLLGYAAEGDWAENAVFWDVTLEGGPENPYFFLNAEIDDETGALLRIQVSQQRSWDVSQLEQTLSAFAALYFGALDIADYASFATDDLSEQYVGDAAAATRYRFGDSVYGEINVDLYVYENGFYTVFPSR